LNVALDPEIVSLDREYPGMNLFSPGELCIREFGIHIVAPGDVNRVMGRHRKICRLLHDKDWSGGRRERVVARYRLQFGEIGVSGCGSGYDSRGTKRLNGCCTHTFGESFSRLYPSILHTRPRENDTVGNLLPAATATVDSLGGWESLCWCGSIRNTRCGQ
jgi:hypothetical protein